MSPKNKTRRGPLPGSPQRGGWDKKPDEERMKQGCWSVKGKYFLMVKKKIETLTKKYK